MSLALVLMLAFGAIACGSDDEDDEPPTVSNADSCEELADAFIPIIQSVLDEASEMTMAEMTSGEEPEFLGDLEDQVSEAEAKSNELECTDDEMGALLEERFDELTASGPVGEMILEGMRQEGFNLD